MKRRDLQRSGQPASDLLEDAVRLLRRAPLSAWLAYFIGTVPGLLGALYFFFDMGHRGDAESRLVGSSLALGAVWLWMKCWQAVFCCRLRAELLLLDPPTWTAGRVARLAAAQIALQPLGLIVRPLALVLTLPYIWVATFFQNVTVLGDGEDDGVRALFRSAFAQCLLWPLQAHFAASLLLAFGFFVWLNIAIAIFSLPQLGRMFFGVESMFSQNPMGMLNFTTLAVSLATLYLCLDPLRKAIHVLRCFAGSSLRSGADLEVQLKTARRAAPPAAAFAALVLLLLGALGPAPAHAAMKQEPKVGSTELSESLDDVLSRREYSWRTPREDQPQAGEDSWFGKIMKDFGEWTRQQVKALAKWVGKIMTKIGDWVFPDREYNSGDGTAGFMSLFGNIRFISIVLLVLAVIILVVVLVRRRRPGAVAVAEAVAVRPDLNAENVTADQLPEDGWLQLARELRESGQLRLALRASYLASLAHLGHRELIRLARHKSNHDYDRELQRRARANTELLGAFDRNLDAFERAWYGEHEVTDATLGDFSHNLERIRAC
jgi:hypothetical protein